jgi:hypothetical protein
MRSKLVLLGLVWGCFGTGLLVACGGDDSSSSGDVPDGSISSSSGGSSGSNTLLFFGEPVFFSQKERSILFFPKRALNPSKRALNPKRERSRALKSARHSRLGDGTHFCPTVLIF